VIEQNDGLLHLSLLETLTIKEQRFIILRISLNGKSQVINKIVEAHYENPKNWSYNILDRCCVYDSNGLVGQLVGITNVQKFVTGAD